MKLFVLWQYRLNEVITVDSPIMDVRPAWVNDVTGAVVKDAPALVILNDVVGAFLTRLLLDFLQLVHTLFPP